MVPFCSDCIWIADTFGEMGLWYRLSRAALIGGSFGAVEGHNRGRPSAWASPSCTAPAPPNFAADYASLTAADACRKVLNSDDLLTALADPGLPAMAARATQVQAAAQDGLQRTARICSICWNASMARPSPPPACASSSPPGPSSGPSPSPSSSSTSAAAPAATATTAAIWPSGSLGRYRQTMTGAVWVHAVSLGEMRSAVPLIRAVWPGASRS